MEHILEQAIKTLLDLGILVNFKGNKFFDKNHADAANFIETYNKKYPKKKGKLPVAVKKQVTKILKKSFSKDTETRLITEIQMLVFLVKETFQIQNGHFVEDIYPDKNLGIRSNPMHLNKVNAKILEEIFDYGKKVGINISNHPEERRSVWVVIRDNNGDRRGKHTLPKHPLAQILHKQGFKTQLKNDKHVLVQIIKGKDAFIVKNDGCSDSEYQARVAEIIEILKNNGYKCTERIAKKHTVIEFKLKVTKPVAKKVITSRKGKTFFDKLDEKEKGFLNRLFKEMGIVIPPDPLNMDDKELKNLFETLGQDRIVIIMKKAFPDLMIIPKANAL